MAILNYRGLNVATNKKGLQVVLKNELTNIIVDLQNDPQRMFTTNVASLYKLHFSTMMRPRRFKQKKASIYKNTR